MSKRVLKQEAVSQKWEDLVGKLPVQDGIEHKAGVGQFAKVSLSFWLSAGKPHVWKYGNSAIGLLVLVDEAYGLIAVFDGNEPPIVSANGMVVQDDYVVLGKQYGYSVPSIFGRVA